MELTFLGATGTVTGSRYLLTSGREKILVDCGLFQGLKDLRLENRRPFPLPASELAAVVLTHAHLDHSGYLPLLVASGFEGPIFCTPATADLCRILLPDSGHLQEEEAERANKHGYSKHSPALPLYTRADAEVALEQLVTVPVHRPSTVGGIEFTFRRAGHILGSATAALRGDGATIVFSGDLGRAADPVLLPPEPVAEADYLVVESTYGDRLHEAENTQTALADAINRTAHRGGVVVIPSFAVARAQVLLWHLNALRDRGAVPALPVFLDSPMAIEATDIFIRHPEEHRLSPAQCVTLRATATMTSSSDDSKEIDRRRGPMIIISASGMATGGRILFHLERFAPDPRNTILLVGHQAVGTRGADMMNGRDHIRIHGADVPVRAEVVTLHGLSAHADADEILGWLKHFQRPPRQTFVTHGEPGPAAALRDRIEHELGWHATVPAWGERVTLEPGAGPK